MTCCAVLCCAVPPLTPTHKQDAYLGKGQITITLNFSAVRDMLCRAVPCCAVPPLTPHNQDNYLGKDQITITLNFSKSAMNVVGQL
jgi:hypothetical protein